MAAPDQIRKWLRAAVAHSGTTATEVARRAGYSQTTVTRYLAGRSGTMRVKTLRAIADVTGYPLPPEIDPTPPPALDEIAVATQVARSIPVNQAITPALHDKIVREVVDLFQRARRRREDGR